MTQPNNISTMDQLTSLHCRNAALETELRLTKEQLCHSQNATTRIAALEVELRIAKEQLTHFRDGSIHLVSLLNHEAYQNPSTQIPQQQEINDLRRELDHTLHYSTRLQNLLATSRRTVEVLQQRDVRRSNGRLRAPRRDEDSNEGDDDLFGLKADWNDAEYIASHKESRLGPLNVRGRSSRPQGSGEQGGWGRTGWTPKNTSDCYKGDLLLHIDDVDGSVHEEKPAQAAATIWKPSSGQARFINREAFRAEKARERQGNGSGFSRQSDSKNADEALEKDGMEWDFSREEPGCGSPSRLGSERGQKDGWATMAAEQKPSAKTSTGARTAVEVPDGMNFSLGVSTSQKSKWATSFPQAGRYSVHPKMPLKYRIPAHQHRHLAGMACFLEDMTPEEYEESWYEFAAKQRSHSPSEWREYYEAEIRPTFRERAAREKTPSPEIVSSHEKVVSSDEVSSSEKAPSPKDTTSPDTVSRPEEATECDETTSPGKQMSPDKRRDSLLIDVDTEISGQGLAETKVAGGLSSTQDDAVAESNESVNLADPRDALKVENRDSESLPTTAISLVSEAEEEGEGEGEEEEEDHPEAIETGTARPVVICSFSKEEVTFVSPSPPADALVAGTVLITGIPVGTKLEEVLGEDVSAVEYGVLYQTAHVKSTPLLSGNTALVQFYDIREAQGFCAQRDSPFIGLLDTIVDSAALKDFVPLHGGLRPPEPKKIEVGK